MKMRRVWMGKVVVLAGFAVLLGAVGMQGGCAMHRSPRYELEQVGTDLDFQFSVDPPEDAAGLQELGVDPAMLLSFTGYIRIDKQTGETWLFVPQLEAEESYWKRLPEVE